MYHFFAYGIEHPDKGIIGNIFKNKAEVINFCNQNQIPVEFIKMLYSFKQMQYIEPEEPAIS